jgi:ribosomal protein S14
MTRTEHMPSHSNPVRSRSQCPRCGNALYYTRATFTFLTGRLKRKCLAANCSFQDSGRFKIADRGYSRRLDVS